MYLVIGWCNCRTKKQNISLAALAEFPYDSRSEGFWVIERRFSVLLRGNICSCSWAYADCKVIRLYCSHLDTPLHVLPSAWNSSTPFHCARQKSALLVLLSMHISSSQHKAELGAKNLHLQNRPHLTPPLSLCSFHHFFHLSVSLLLSYNKLQSLLIPVMLIGADRHS